ncbi:MAG: AMP-binding protein [Spirochaetales bacterium]|uniref:AMP-binding protein n=1 Tax=Candidatus Thalassospirochaeta sargassi TaxID=3119039 RepID=A0AAJ1MKR3_9SPIO|nr:AMP-binding protein [Spirochaetales bacterium]
MLERNFVKTIENSLKDNWEQPCFSDFEADPHSYRDIAESMLIFHEVFRKCGIKKGDKLAVCGKNSVNWVKCYLATVTYGAVIVPILPDFHGDDITNIINHSESKIFFADEAIWKKLNVKDLPALEVGGNLDDFHVFMTKGSINDGVIAEARGVITERYKDGLKKEDVIFDEIPNGELAGILYTSGTTGFSKGVMLSHNSLMANVDYAQKSIPVKAKDTIVNFLPLAHCFGAAFDFLFPFATGCHITFLPRLTPQLILKAMDDIKPRLILSVPLLIEKIYFKQLKPILSKGYAQIPGIKQLLEKIIAGKLNKTFGGNFISIVIGAAAFNPEVEAFLTKIKFRFTVGYGMTECGPLISYMPWNVYKSGSAGKLIFHLEAKLDNPDPETGQGELCVKGENVMLGYYKNDEATKETIDAEGWLHTGDMVTLDEDQVVTIKGRCKNMLLGSGGQNIYPEEIEARLNNHDIVSDALVIDRDGKVTAILYPDPDFAKAANLTADGIKEEIEKAVRAVDRELPLYSKIINFEIREEEFEKTPTSKIKRFLYK